MDIWRNAVYKVPSDLFGARTAKEYIRRIIDVSSSRPLLVTIVICGSAGYAIGSLVHSAKLRRNLKLMVLALKNLPPPIRSYVMYCSEVLTINIFLIEARTIYSSFYSKQMAKYNLRIILVWISVQLSITFLTNIRPRIFYFRFMDISFLPLSAVGLLLGLFDHTQDVAAIMCMLAAINKVISKVYLTIEAVTFPFRYANNRNEGAGGGVGRNRGAAAGNEDAGVGPNEGAAEGLAPNEGAAEGLAPNEGAAEGLGPNEGAAEGLGPNEGAAEGVGPNEDEGVRDNGAPAEVNEVVVRGVGPNDGIAVVDNEDARVRDNEGAVGGVDPNEGVDASDNEAALGVVDSNKGATSDLGPIEASAAIDKDSYVRDNGATAGDNEGLFGSFGFKEGVATGANEDAGEEGGNEGAGGSSNTGNDSGDEDTDSDEAADAYEKMKKNILSNDEGTEARMDDECYDSGDDPDYVPGEHGDEESSERSDEDEEISDEEVRDVINDPERYSTQQGF